MKESEKEGLNKRKSTKREKDDPLSEKFLKINIKTERIGFTQMFLSISNPTPFFPGNAPSHSTQVFRLEVTIGV